jgi:hypothetical protein
MRKIAYWSTLVLVCALAMVFLSQDTMAVRGLGTVDIGTMYLGGTKVTATAAEINALDGIGATLTYDELDYLDITTLGTGAASKAIVLDAGEDFTWPATGVLAYGGTGITANGAEINYLDLAALGTGAASKAVVLDA